MSEYPKDSSARCPECDGPTEWNEAVSDFHSPGSQNGHGQIANVGLYCKSKECVHSRRPIDDDTPDDSPHDQF